MFEITRSVIIECAGITEKKYVDFKEFRDVLAVKDHFIGAHMYASQLSRSLYLGEIGIVLEYNPVPYIAIIKE